MSIKSSTIAVRALNSAKRLHLPSYFGLRYLLDSFVDLDKSSIFILILKNYLRHSILDRYSVFHELKGIAVNGEEYREFLSGSPLTLLAESFLLNRLSKEPDFQFSKRVFSYLWPENDWVGANYSHFLYPYFEKNEEIKRRFKKNTMKIAVIMDIKSFYPSIPVKATSELINKKKFKDKELQKFFQNFSLAFLRFSRSDKEIYREKPKGIPIGPDISHLLANIVLEKFDQYMYKKYKNDYFRYVDDIVIICEPYEAENVKKEVSEFLMKELGLSLNKGKNDEVSSEHWIQEAPVKDNKKYSLGKLLDELIDCAYFNPSDFRDLKTRFKDAGVPLPLERIERNSKYSRWQKRIKKKIKYIIYSPPKLQDIYTRMNKLKEELLNTLSSLYNESAKYQNNKTRQRWYLQQIRYVLGQLLYLTPISELQSILNLIPDIFDELIPLAKMISCLLNRNVTPILKYPGRTVTTFADLWMIQNAEKPEIDLTDGFNSDFEAHPIVFDSLIILLIHGLITEDLFTNLHLTPLQENLVKFFSNKNYGKRLLADLSYLDEMLSLKLGSRISGIKDYLNTRYNPDEMLYLPARQYDEYEIS